MATLNDSHFDLFHLPPIYAVDQETLDHAYRTVQAQVHPDRFAAAGDAQRASRCNGRRARTRRTRRCAIR